MVGELSALPKLRDLGQIGENRYAPATTPSGSMSAVACWQHSRSVLNLKRTPRRIIP